MKTLFEKVWDEHVVLQEQGSPSVLSIDLHYEEGAEGAFTPVVRHVEMRNVTSRRSNYGIYVRAIPDSVIEDIRLVDCRFDGVERARNFFLVAGLSVVAVWVLVGSHGISLGREVPLIQGAEP